MKKSLLAGLVSALFAASAQAFDPFVVRDIRVEGIQRTEAGTVFLMGLVRPAEADIAVDVASTTSGVKKVVKLFEYID